MLYGSRAQGNFKNGSDIDLTRFGHPELTLKLLNRIMDALDDLLLPYTIDLSIFDDLGDVELVEHMQRVGVTFYHKADTRFASEKGCD